MSFRDALPGNVPLLNFCISIPTISGMHAAAGRGIIFSEENTIISRAVVIDPRFASRGTKKGSFVAAKLLPRRRRRGEARVSRRVSSPKSGTIRAVTFSAEDVVPPHINYFKEMQAYKS